MPQTRYRVRLDSSRVCPRTEFSKLFRTALRMAQTIILALIGVLLLVGSLAGLKVLQFQTMFAQGANFTPPPETVTTAEVTRDTW